MVIREKNVEFTIDLKPGIKLPEAKPYQMDTKRAEAAKKIIDGLVEKDFPTHGKGGAMHTGDISVGAFPANAIVGGNIPIAVGIGLACKMRN